MYVGSYNEVSYIQVLCKIGKIVNIIKRELIRISKGFELGLFRLVRVYCSL